MGNNAFLRYLGLGQKKELTCRISHFGDSLVIEYPIPFRIGSPLSPFGLIPVALITLGALIPLMIFHRAASAFLLFIIAALVILLALTYWYGFSIKLILSSQSAKIEFISRFVSHSWVYDMAHVANLRAVRANTHAGAPPSINWARYIQEYELLDWSFKTLCFDYGSTTVDVWMELTEKDVGLALSAVRERFPHILAPEVIPVPVSGVEEK